MNRYLTKGRLTAYEKMLKHTPLGNCKLEQWASTTDLLAWLKIQNTDYINCWQGCGATGTVIPCQWECKVEATSRDSLAGSYKAKHGITTWPSKCAPEYLPEEVKNYVHTKSCTQIIYSSFIHNCAKLETTKMSFNRWIAKQTTICPDNGKLFNSKVKWSIKPGRDREKA